MTDRPHSKTDRLTFLSRHVPTREEEELGRRLGFSAIARVDMDFDDDPVRQVERLGLGRGSAVAMVGPIWVALALLRAGYVVVEFQNDPVFRRRGQFACRSVRRMTLRRTEVVTHSP